MYYNTVNIISQKRGDNLESIYSSNILIFVIYSFLYTLIIFQMYNQKYCQSSKERIFFSIISSVLVNLLFMSSMLRFSTYFISPIQNIVDTLYPFMANRINTDISNLGIHMLQYLAIIVVLIVYTFSFVLFIIISLIPFLVSYKLSGLVFKFNSTLSISIIQLFVLISIACISLRAFLLILVYFSI